MRKETTPAKGARRLLGSAQPRKAGAESGWRRLDVSVLSTHPTAPRYLMGTGARSPGMGVLRAEGANFSHSTGAASPGPAYHVQDKFRYPKNPLWSFSKGSRAQFARLVRSAAGECPPAAGDVSRAFAACKPGTPHFRFPHAPRFREGSADATGARVTTHASWKVLSAFAAAPAYTFSRQKHYKPLQRESGAQTFAAYDAFGPQPFSQKRNAPAASWGTVKRARQPHFFSCDMSTADLSLKLPHAYY